MIGVYRFLTYVLQLSLYFNCGYASPVGVHNVSKRDDAVISAGNTTHSTPTNWGGKYDGDYVEVRLYGEKDGIGIDIKGLWHPIRGYLGATGYDIEAQSADLFNVDDLLFGPGDSIPISVKNANYDLEVTFRHQSTYYGDLYVVVKGVAHMVYYDELRVIKNTYKPYLAGQASATFRNTTTTQPY